MTVPNIVAFRIGERPIHEQGQPWIRAPGMNMVIVTNDSVSEDTMQQTLMKTVVPKIIAVCFFSAQRICDIIIKAPPRQATFIVCKMSEDALKLAASGIPVREINVDNIHHIPKKEKMNKYIALSDEDKATLRQPCDTYGVVFSIGTTASGNDGAARVGLNKYL